MTFPAARKLDTNTHEKSGSGDFAMTFPAARKLDTNTHDMLVPAGTIGPPVAGPCPSFGPVMIENQPAAHAGCAVICAGTLSAGVAHPPPPVPPLIVMGAGTVFIHGKPAARWAPAPDISACGSFLGNPALAASRTVFIGEVSLTVAITNLSAMLAAKPAVQPPGLSSRAPPPQPAGLRTLSIAGRPITQRPRRNTRGRPTNKPANPLSFQVAPGPTPQRLPPLLQRPVFEPT